MLVLSWMLRVVPLPKKSGVSRRRAGMAKVAFLVLADTQTREDLGRVVNAMIGTKEFKEGGEALLHLRWAGPSRQTVKMSNRRHRPTPIDRSAFAGFCSRPR
jgi:hypothetical protein